VTPQACGTFTTVSELEPWSAPESGPDATPSSPFTISEGCGAQGFSPVFTAGTTGSQAGGYTPFVVTI
jgi:hypothetical protein